MLLLVIPMLLLVLFVYLRKSRGIASLLIRTVSILLICLAFANPLEEEISSSTRLAAFVDVSSSITVNGKAALADELLNFIKIEKDLSLAVYPFARKISRSPVVLDNSTSRGELLNALRESEGALDTGETNIAGAITQLSSLIESGSALLLSDGFETEDNASESAKGLGKAGARVYPIIPSNQDAFKSSALTLSALYVPLTANAGDSIIVRSAVKNSFSQTRTGTLEIWLDKKKLLENKVSIPGETEKLITVKTPPIEGGLQRIRAVLRPENTAETKNLSELHSWVSVKSKSKILLLSGGVEDRQTFGDVLRLKGYAIQDTVADGTSVVPTDFSGFSVVILNNISRVQLPTTFLDRLQQFVLEGGGLLMLGGDRSFGLGGYIDTPLEKISPVKFVPPQTKKRRLNSAVVLIIDKSASMRSGGKIDSAKQAAITAIEALKDDDFVGVIGFDAMPFTVIRTDKVSEVKPIAARRLANLVASGSTHLLPALGAAREQLRKVQAGRKHIIVLSDGRIPQRGSEYSIESANLQKEGVTVSSVALGIEADVTFMKWLSDNGNGAFYQTLDPSALPEIFIRDIKVTTGEKTLREQSEFPVRLGPSGVVSVSLENFPPLLGFVETIPKDEAALELTTLAGEKTFPILSSWRFGQGKVVAYTSDANGRWSLPWLRWKSYTTFWSQALEGIRGKSGTKFGEIDFDIRYSVSGKNLALDLAVFDNALQSGIVPTITASVTEPGGEQRQLIFQPLKKGRFLAELGNARPGDYRVEINYDQLKFPPLAVSLPGDVFGEKPGGGLNVKLLSDIAYLTGGQLNPSPDSIVMTRQTAEKKNYLLVPLLILAFFLLLLEAFIRELGLLRIFSIVPIPRIDKNKPPRKRAKGIYDKRRVKQAA